MAPRVTLLVAYRGTIDSNRSQSGGTSQKLFDLTWLSLGFHSQVVLEDGLVIPPEISGS